MPAPKIDARARATTTFFRVRRRWHVWLKTLVAVSIGKRREPLRKTGVRARCCNLANENDGNVNAVPDGAAFLASRLDNGSLSGMGRAKRSVMVSPMI
jgi:hypothetical protein